MDKRELVGRFAGDEEERIVLARVLDQMERAQQRSIPCATQFLSPAQRAAAQAMLAACGVPEAFFFGGYEGAERTVCLFLPDYLTPEDYLAAGSPPIGAVEAAFPAGAALTHRDLLGSLMGLGLSRDRLGDLLLSDGRAQIIAAAETVPILLSQLSKAGRYPLRLREIPLDALSPAPAQVRLLHDTVAALRLDAVAAAGFSLSRGKAADLITGGRVSLNHRVCLKPDRAVAQGDTLTCRGLGKCILKTVGGASRKGRILIEMERYV